MTLGPPQGEPQVLLPPPKRTLNPRVDEDTGRHHSAPDYGINGVHWPRGRWIMTTKALLEEEEEEDAEDEERLRSRARALVTLCAITASLTSVLLGYDVGVMSGAILYIGDEFQLSTVQKEMIVGSLNLVAAFGGLLAGKVADRTGRKAAISTACFIFMGGAGIMTFADSYEMLMAGRILTGIGVGCGFVVSPVYITELCPPEIRGRMVTLADVAINFGILLGYMTSFLCDSAFNSESLKWRVMLGLGTVPPLLIVCCLGVLPESPRWLVSRGRHKEALAVLKSVTHSPSEARSTLAVIQKAVTHTSGEPGWLEVLLPRDPVQRAALFIGLGLGFWQQASGSEAAVYYTPTVLQNAGMDSRSLLLMGTMAVGGCKLGGELVAALLLDNENVGRRPLFLVSSVLCTLFLSAIGLSLYMEWSGLPMLVFLCLFMLSFSVGIGPLTFVVASEVLPMHMRGKAVSAVVFVNRSLSGIIALSYLSLAEALTPQGAFWLFSGISGVSVLFYYFYVPETQGKTLEAIQTSIAKEFRLSPPSWAKTGHDLYNNPTFPSSDRLVSSFSSSHIVSVSARGRSFSSSAIIYQDSWDEEGDDDALAAAAELGGERQPLLIQ
jgi:sugar porter (SP) family MFS transporter